MTTPTAGAETHNGITLRRSLRVVEYRLLVYKSIWRGSLFNSFMNPVLFLLAMGVGLGQLIDDASADLPGGVSYLDFVAPGVLAATAMNIAFNESTYPILASVKWLRTAYAKTATPIRPGEIAIGEVLWVAFRVILAATAFLLVIIAFGATSSPWVVLALPGAVLTGVSFAGLVIGFSIRQSDDYSFPTLQRMVVLPMFLFSGSFFPLDQLPTVLQPLAWATPLWHGVELCRGFATGTFTAAGALGHTAFLTLVSAVGVRVAIAGFRKRLTE
jgi:lipooligosaccharide transport system permease protein